MTSRHSSTAAAWWRPDDGMPDAYRHAVLAFIEMHANSELMGALTERDWIPKTPGLRHKMAVLAKTQDEIGHSHLLYMIAADLGVKTRTQMLEDLFAGRSRFHNVFHYRAVTWGDQVAIAFLVDAAALISQQAVFKNCSYGPYKRILRRIIAEEGFHMRLGEDRMMRIAEGTARQRRMFQESLDRWFWPSAAAVRPRFQARRRAAALAHQVRAQRGAARPLGAEVRPHAPGLRVQGSRARSALGRGGPSLGRGPHRLGATQANPRPGVAPTRLGASARPSTTGGAPPG